MEKAVSVEEKIRRAEEIYNRRNLNNIDRYNEKEYKKPSLKRRMIKQIIVCFTVYCIFYVVSNKDFFLSEEFRQQVEEKASQNEFLKNGYEWIKNKYINIFGNKKENQEKTDENENHTESIQVENEINDSQIEDNSINIGGTNENILNQDEKTQEEKDIEDIKKTISFISPINGTISSTFGWRSTTTPSVPKYHTGLDIVASIGTVIKSATDGKIILASSEGDYGNHYKIQINDVTIVYAHCSKLYLNEGEEVKQGQNIAEVGSTGNSTRATSTF